MTEIRVDVDLEQPPSLVWRAFTEAHLVTKWLPTARFMVRDNGTFTFQAHDLEGLEDPIEGELVTIEAPHRLVLRCQGTNLHTVVAMTLTEREGGSHLTLTQSGFLGPQGTMRRRVLLSTYTSVLEGLLSAALARIAAEEPDAGEPPATTSQWRNAGGPFNRLPRQVNSPSRSAPGLSSQRRSTAGPRPTTSVPGFAAAVLGAHTTGVAKVPTEPVPAQRVASRPATVRTARLGDMAVRGGIAVRRGWRWLAGARDWSADRRSQAVATGAAALLLLAMAGVLIGKATALHPADPPHTGGDTSSPLQASAPAVAAPQASTPRPVAPAATRSSAPVASPTPSPSTPSTVGLAQPTATYKTENLTLTSYRVTLTITNPGPAAADDWTVAIVLPLLDLNVRNVDGAVMSRSGLRVIFTPVDATRTIAPSASAAFRFEVAGLGVRNGPFTCQINGHPCTGIPG
ncbi:SRPBCC domain-containing protein [Dactylosporangium sp. NPDC051485]|uniref:SRPBCC domain-containing protein n=1 Tax=Dactylosporangium sp. NPDC051485 TaxID=3154846 RepID=UPI00343AAF60